MQRSDDVPIHVIYLDSRCRPRAVQSKPPHKRCSAERSSHPSMRLAPDHLALLFVARAKARSMSAWSMHPRRASVRPDIAGMRGAKVKRLPGTALTGVSTPPPTHFILFYLSLRRDQPALSLPFACATTTKNKNKNKTWKPNRACSKTKKKNKTHTNTQNTHHRGGIRLHSLPGGVVFPLSPESRERPRE